MADVSDEAQVLAFRDAVAAQHDTDHVHLLFNNAGIGGGGSFVIDEHSDWERTFDICEGGVHLCTRAFMPMLLASPEGHVVNTSSVNEFRASLGPHIPHTAYSAAKLAINSGRVLGRGGLDVSGASDDDIRLGMQAQAESFRDDAPMTAAEAATRILDGVRAGEWRILVGDDAVLLDARVRESPWDAYEPAFTERINADGAFGFVPRPADPCPPSTDPVVPRSSCTCGSVTPSATSGLSARSSATTEVR